MMQLDNYQYSAGVTEVTTTTFVDPPIVTENDITKLVSIINREIKGLANAAPGAVITIINYNVDGTVSSTQEVPLTKKAILNQISDLEYRLLLFSNAATTKEELTLVSNTKETISSWKTKLAEPIVIDPIIQIIPLDINDPDYAVINYYMSYILSYNYITTNSEWLIIYKYVNKITPVLDALKNKYVGDLTLLAFEETLTKTIANFTDCSTIIPPT